MGVAYGTAIIVALAVIAACALLLSLAFTGAALAYARRRGLLDQPGKRRSHTQPTPRGGGIGIVAAIVLAGVPAWCVIDRASAWTQPAAAVVAVLAVALIGWRDDHAPLPVVPRLLVHAGAALLVGAAALAPWAMHEPELWWILLPLVLVLIGFINAHNFMDGIDGILGQQGLFVTLGLGVLALWHADAGIAMLAFAAAAGCLGFLFFNWPPAKIFMGDVGSGALGLAIGAVAAFVVQRNPAMIWACAILPSAFLVDSGLTLARRMLAGQRWYAPHRQHLYQWLVRVNWSHARTDVAYMIWNLAVVAPLVALAAFQPAHGVWYFIAAWGAAACVWFAGKRACLARARSFAPHESA
ncbi:MAG: Undecaprenyl-phosphate alpha-N-acetylglucosaminyl 1-phosphate transferase [Rhodanobacteraceae bacterium]|jgi:Fuc2NAc and GlcNAc transferase|nr:MAG: Undecaprenyl-phosphate alpha-N-acetylglucosaminyl 1-phosphate transferase [Rhodanobacteraceae bacterium]